jgi:PadR family transcriptional regulator, regulatory protein PadR
MIERELVAASSASIVLSILNESDSYGYEIIQRVTALTSGELAWSEAMLYPVLHRLELRKCVRSYWRDSLNGRKRKYYAITPSGSNALVEKRRQWALVTCALNALWAK